MRKVMDEQQRLGEVDIASIKLDLNSRDEIPPLLRGLQEIYVQTELREAVFAILDEACGQSSIGRPGMDLWRVLVLGTIRLNCGCDLDKLKELADNHLTIREMLGHPRWLDETQYPLQTLRDNIRLITPELLDKINALVVIHGQSIIRKNGDTGINARCDSYVVETNVHFPTDANLLWDAIRKEVELIAALFESLGMTEWRQWASQLDKIKNLFLIYNRIGHSTSKNPDVKANKEKEKKRACESLLKKAGELTDKVLDTLSLIPTTDDIMNHFRIGEIRQFADYAKHQMDLLERRVIKGEVISHDEKIFSLFETHTEWISKGKAGTPQELGLRLCVMEDQYGFVINHHLMQGEQDVNVAVPIVEATKKNFPELHSCSFDKGFWSPANAEKLETTLDVVILPKKGKLSKEQMEKENEADFKKGRKKHCAIESGIAALENHGLDRCPDRGLRNFEHYVSLGVLARNIQKLGTVLMEKEREFARRSERIREGLRKRRMKKAA